MRRYGELDFHGDEELAPDLIDLAVNVRSVPAPGWLAAPIAASLRDLARYPDQREAIEAVAARHHRDPGEVLLTAGAAQAFTLIAHATAAPGTRSGAACSPVVVHPQFTEPEAALRAVGLPVRRLLLTADRGFRFDPAAVPDDADLVVIGNPTNPTSVAHPADAIASLARPGRVLVVDEAFADTVPGEPESLASRRDLPGLVVIRSLTKTWGLAGLRIGYLLAAPEIVERLAAHQPLWPVSTPALAAATACASPRAVAEEQQIATELIIARDHLIARLREVDGVTVAGEPASSFVLIHIGGREVAGGHGAGREVSGREVSGGHVAGGQAAGGDAVRAGLRSAGFAVRRGDTFPGLGVDWLRVAVRETAVSDTFVDALATIMATITKE